MMGTVRRTTPALAFVALTLTFCLAGCTESSTQYPTVSTVTDLGKVLSPEEREKAMRELRKEGEAQTKAADEAGANAR